MDEVKTIEFDQHEAAMFKAKYDKAVADEKETFTFRGDLFLTSYAGYLLEFLKTEGVFDG